MTAPDKSQALRFIETLSGNHEDSCDSHHAQWCADCLTVLAALKKLIEAQ